MNAATTTGESPIAKTPIHNALPSTTTTNQNESTDQKLRKLTFYYKKNVSYDKTALFGHQT